MVKFESVDVFYGFDKFFDVHLFRSDIVANRNIYTIYEIFVFCLIILLLVLGLLLLVLNWVYSSASHHTFHRLFSLLQKFLLNLHLLLFPNALLECIDSSVKILCLMNSG